MGSSAAASRPRAQAVRWYAEARRSRPGRTGGCPRTRRIRGPWAAARSAGSDGSRSARTADGLATASTVVALPSPSARRSSPSRAWSGPTAPPSSRWTKPRTSRNASSKASHGLRSRQCSPVVDGSRTCPPVTLSAAARPPPVPRRLAGRIAWMIARRRAASTGAARRSPSMRSMIATRPTSWRGAWMPSNSSISDGAPSTVGNRSRAQVSAASRPGSAVARRRSSASSGAWRCSVPPRWSRQTVQR